MSKEPFLQIDEHDNLIVALQPLSKGEIYTIGNRTVEIRQEIPEKHKFSLDSLDKGEQAIMYGVIVGTATQPIPAGELVTTANLHHATSLVDNARKSTQWHPPTPFADQKNEFLGFRRHDGRCGTANYWIFIPLVFCSNQELLLLKDILPRLLGYTKPSRYEEFTASLVEQMRTGASASPPPVLSSCAVSPQSRLFPNIDGIKFLTHNLGCGGTRSDAQSLCAFIAGYITHPNVAGATVISLGCQNAETSLLKQEINRKDPDCRKPVLFFDRQSWNQPVDMTEVIIQQTLHEMAQANKAVRTPVPVSELIIGVECGASDGFSGISANPVIGRTIDQLVAAGGSAILSEFPELCGVENELIGRCRSDEISERFIQLINSYRKHARHFGVDFDMNPSPGNIRDGLITDAMKSAGAAKKGGTSPIVDVLDYTERLEHKGLNLLCTPGGDVESTTAMVGSGANLIMFSTGMGTPTGNAIVPVIKVSSNSSVARRLSYMIDFDTGPLLSGERSISSLSKDLLELCLQTASGTYTTKAVRLGQDDFIPWKRQVSL